MSIYALFFLGGGGASYVGLFTMKNKNKNHRGMTIDR